MAFGNYNNNTNDRPKSLPMFNVPTESFTNPNASKGRNTNLYTTYWLSNLGLAIAEPGEIGIDGRQSYDRKGSIQVFFGQRNALSMFEAIKLVTENPEIKNAAVSLSGGSSGFMIYRPEVFNTKGFVIELKKTVDGKIRSAQYETKNKDEDAIAANVKDGKFDSVNLDYYDVDLWLLQVALNAYIEASTGAIAAMSREANKDEWNAIREKFEIGPSNKKFTGGNIFLQGMTERSGHTDDTVSEDAIESALAGIGIV